MNRLVRFVPAVMALVATVWAPNALSIDRKIFPGAMCRPSHGAQPADFEITEQGIKNITSALRHVTCPIVRDNVLNNTGVSSVYVRGRRNISFTNPVGPLSCSLFSHRVNAGANGGILSRDIVATNSEGFSELELLVDQSEPYAHYAIRCALPRGAIVYSYRVDEF